MKELIDRLKKIVEKVMSKSENADIRFIDLNKLKMLAEILEIINNIENDNVN